MRGHGTYLDPEADNLIASVVGAIVQTNKLIRVKPVKSRWDIFLYLRKKKAKNLK